MAAVATFGTLSASQHAAAQGCHRVHHRHCHRMVYFFPDKQTLIDEIAAWEHDRNANHAKANWQFTTPTARIKLNLYPSI
jgi:hypothetical protein